MNGNVSTTNGQSIPLDIMSNIEKTLSKSVLGKILEEYIMGEVKLTMWIPEELAGKVIGKKGLVVQNLTRETKTKSITALPRVGDSLWLAVVIFGDTKPVFNACKAVSDLVDGEVDDVVFEFTINYRKPFFLYGGKKFAVIKKISADTNVRIFYPEFDPKTQPYKDALPFTLEGSSQNVIKAIVLLEREALLYEYQQTARLEKCEADSLSSGDSFIKDAKSVQRTQQQTLKKTTKDTTTSSSSSTKNNVAVKEDMRNSKAKSSNKLVDTTGIERILASGDARLMSARARPLAAEVVASSSNGSGSNYTAAGLPATTIPSSVEMAVELTTAAASTTAEPTTGTATVEDTSTAPVPVAITKVEKVVNIPTSLVGLLLSKHPKASATTLNAIQVMTHTIISKLPPAGFVSSLAATSTVEVGTKVVEAHCAGEAGEGISNSEKVRRRRMGSEEESAGKAEEDGSGSDSEGSEESESEETDSSSATERADEGTEAGGIVHRETIETNNNNIVIEEKKETLILEGELLAEDALVGGGRTLEQLAKEAEKKRMIEESEKLGYVPFRVVGYHEENVDAVLAAIQEIIEGKRIGEVLEGLKVSAKRLQWPPHRATTRNSTTYTASSSANASSRGRKTRDSSSTSDRRIKKVRLPRSAREPEGQDEQEYKPFRPRGGRVSKSYKGTSSDSVEGRGSKHSKHEYTTTTGAATGASNRERRFSKKDSRTRA